MTTKENKKKAYLIVPSSGWLFGAMAGGMMAIALIALLFADLVGRCNIP